MGDAHTAKISSSNCVYVGLLSLTKFDFMRSDAASGKCKETLLNEETASG